jgi:hypothetical protein
MNIKAQNNISMRCKKFYIESLLKEVSPDLNKNSTYLLIHEPLDTILNKHEKDIKTFGFQLPTTQRQLPYLMWTPKMHKHPIKQRFIAISSSCTTKLVSSILTSCLKLVQTAHYYYCNKIKTYTGFNFMWTIQNSQEIFPKLHGKIRNLKTYDFSTLYTSIPHKKLLKELAEIVTKAFHGMRQKFIKITGKSYTATWCTNISTKKGCYYINCDTLIKMITWLVNNTYVTVGKKIYQQIIGIPMGTDCAPYLANLYLFSYEFRFMNNQLIAKNFDRLYKFNRSCRYLDDLLLINNDNTMETFKNSIYPTELAMSSDDKSDQQVNYLDLNLEIKNHSIIHKIFDKRDKFTFPIINFPNLTGNVPKSHSYGVFTAQLIRYARGCQLYTDFKSRVQTLFDRLVNQNFKKSKLIKTYQKFLLKYSHLVKKYGKPLLLNIRGYLDPSIFND